MALNSIEKEWERFAAAVFRGTLPSPVQVEEMKKIFFAGAFALFMALEEIGEPHISAEHGEKYLKSIKAECGRFYDRLKADCSAKSSPRNTRNTRKDE